MPNSSGRAVVDAIVTVQAGGSCASAGAAMQRRRIIETTVDDIHALEACAILLVCTNDP
jgi:hypothetical protein